ncbi:MAG: ABC transporter ATP-binding protein [Deltaproteobacteria bacterium]|nr:ABC transporter ATP-binding protein [Deltaproteobacteria bacterium]
MAGSDCSCAECASDECLVEIRGLVKRYGSRKAIDGVDLTVQQGEVLGLLGPNGAGKSTTMAVLSTLTSFDAGTISLCGLRLPRDAARVKRLLGIVPQELALYPSLSGTQNLSFFGRIYGLRGRALSERIARVLEIVGLSNRARDPVRSYSGGMQRRLNMAASLLHRPRIVLLDEPMVGVDPQSRNLLLEHIERMRAECHTMIYTTHNMDEAARLCDRVAIMDGGRILAVDTTAELLKLLGSGVIHLACSGQESMAAPLAELESVRSLDTSDGVLRIRVSDTQAALLEITRLCHERSATIHSLEALEPNLESVFLHLTGKSLRD